MKEIVADIKMEQMNLGEIQAGKFYGEKGVSINTAFVLSSKAFSIFFVLVVSIKVALIPKSL